MQDPRIHLRQLALVEPRRCTAEPGEIERRDQRRGVGDRLDRIARSDPREQRAHRLWLDPDVPEMIRAERAQPLG
jgi:hypothetical protein